MVTSRGHTICCLDGVCTIPDAAWHGSNSGYATHGCRCEPCREAHREKYRAWANNEQSRARNNEQRRARYAITKPPPKPRKPRSKPEPEPGPGLPEPPAVVTITSGTQVFGLCSGCGCWTARYVPECRCACHRPDLLAMTRETPDGTRICPECGRHYRGIALTCCADTEP